MSRVRPAVQGQVPANPPMPASRRHDLTQAVGAALLQEQFQESRAARCFLRKVFAAENADVTVARAGVSPRPSGPHGGPIAPYPRRPPGCFALCTGPCGATIFLSYSVNAGWLFPGGSEGNLFHG